jgi:hypothetical protein
MNAIEIDAVSVSVGDAAAGTTVPSNVAQARGASARQRAVAGAPAPRLRRVREMLRAGKITLALAAGYATGRIMS